MRLIVTGRRGQVARALVERGPSLGVEVTALGRPDLDLTDAVGVGRALDAIEGDVIVNAAAYTAVDVAESEEELATQINSAGAGAVARAAARRGLPLLQLSTDYVFDGSLDRTYRETDPVCPIGAYGRSKLAGEYAVAAAHPGSVILRTAWIYAPFGANFLRTMLRLGETREEVSVVCDQLGTPTYALDIADALVAIARRRCAAPADASLAGVFHMTGGGEATWEDFAAEIFAQAALLGRKRVTVRSIATKDYPTAARRPVNSRLSNDKLAQMYNVILPDWRTSTRKCIERIVESQHSGEDIQ
jgi:dTDP-4-dehydrorhamnose reductase